MLWLQRIWSYKNQCPNKRNHISYNNNNNYNDNNNNNNNYQPLIINNNKKKKISINVIYAPNATPYYIVTKD